MKQAGLVIALTLSLLSAPLTPAAQQAKKVYQIGVLSVGPPPIPPEPPQGPLVEALRELGYAEGRNVAFHWRWADNRLENLPALAAELVRLEVDILVTSGTTAAKAAKQATGTIPILFSIGTDPVKHGLVTSLARPGGNLTGFTSTSIGELAGKRLQFLKEAIPELTKVGVLTDAQGSPPPRWDAAHGLGIEVHYLLLKTESDLEQTFAAATRSRVGGLILDDSQILVRNRARIGSLALRHRLPTIGAHADYAEAGLLMSYAPNQTVLIRRRAALVDRILRGAKPADLPVEQPTNFNLVINLKTAKALGLTIPTAVLARADEVIQ